ncbi:sensor histidine kinase [Desulfospira joergensenii]|uniref:sensor histidine kinase n=1 Tax=Desulfospira joergensenii TaxID=53329 RepID=UPI0003B4745D|nr:sensor histidine kinase [Desulfospira joergensenii]
MFNPIKPLGGRDRKEGEASQPRRPGVQKSIIVIVALTALAFVAASAVMSQWSIREMSKIVRNQFNQEQMVIAHNVKHYIENRFSFLKREVDLAAKALGRGDSPDRAIRSALSRLVECGVSRIEVRDRRTGRAWYGKPFCRDVIHTSVEQTLPLPPALPPGTPLDQQVTDPRLSSQGISLAIISPVAPGGDHLVVCHINLAWFLGSYLKTIRSGRTGYAWIIDKSGRFLFHPDVSFAGKSAFEARQERDQNISFVEINKIQRDEMLHGREGTGQYISGWHRGLTGKMEKLIAYTPISIHDRPSQNWSVAVVAPVSEIEQAVRDRYMRQFFVQLGVVFAIIAGASVIMFFEVKWSRRMEKEVTRQTGERVKTQSEYRSLVESAEDIIFTVDRQAVFLSMNSFTAGFFGCRAGDHIRKDISSLVPETIARELRMMIQAVFQGAKSMRRELGFLHHENLVFLDANLVPVRTGNRPVTSVLCIARDITEHKKMERHLVQTEKMASLGTLAAGVAHEINNPLGVILGFCELMLGKKEPCSQEYEDLKIIERQGFHCKEIVENLLDFVRTGEESDYQRTGVNSCLENAIKIIRHRFEKEGIDLNTELGVNLPPVKAGFRKLQQVFLNLINNAADAMPRGGTLTIQTLMDLQSDMVVIRFKDQGVAIDDKDMDHIFEPFFTTKPEGKGTGLGLFVSYGIITGFGGAMECHSRKTRAKDLVSGGTTFTIKLLKAREEK